MEVAINKNIYQQAQAYARQQGLSLNAVIESFLVRFIGRSQAAAEQPVPDIVLSLLGAGDPVSDDGRRVSCNRRRIIPLTEKT